MIEMDYIKDVLLELEDEKIITSISDSPSSLTIELKRKGTFTYNDIKDQILHIISYLEDYEVCGIYMKKPEEEGIWRYSVHPMNDYDWYYTRLSNVPILTEVVYFRIVFQKLPFTKRYNKNMRNRIKSFKNFG